MAKKDLGPGVNSLTYWRTRFPFRIVGKPNGPLQFYGASPLQFYGPDPPGGHRTKLNTLDEMGLDIDRCGNG